MAENKIILDPGSHPASVFAEASPDRPRDLAGMTNYDTASKGGDFRDGLSAIEESDFITGQTIVVDGGATMH